MREFVITGYVISNVGLKHLNNEDSYLMNEVIKETPQHNREAELVRGKKNVRWQWAGVFDGMGGGDRGEMASLMAAEAFRDVLLKGSINATEQDIDRIVRQGYLNANRRIVEERKKHAILGTTATLVCLNENKAKVFHLGDSRAYLLREGRMYQLTKDQTLAVLKVEAGIYDVNHPDFVKDNRRLTEFVGADETMEGLAPTEGEWITLKAADKLLLCSDGLTHFCTGEEIYTIMQSGNNPRELTGKLVAAALGNGGTDNVTCLVLTVGSGKSCRAEEKENGGETNGN